MAWLVLFDRSKGRGASLLLNSHHLLGRWTTESSDSIVAAWTVQGRERKRKRKRERCSCASTEWTWSSWDNLLIKEEKGAKRHLPFRVRERDIENESAKSFWCCWFAILFHRCQSDEMNKNEGSIKNRGREVKKARTNRGQKEGKLCQANCFQSYFQ